VVGAGIGFNPSSVDIIDGIGVIGALVATGSVVGMRDGERASV
jgi:hypothetical protein